VFEERVLDHEALRWLHSQNRFAAKVASSLNPASLGAPSFSRRLQDDDSWHRQSLIVGLLAIMKSPERART